MLKIKLKAFQSTHGQSSYIKKTMAWSTIRCQNNFYEWHCLITDHQTVGGRLEFVARILGGSPKLSSSGLAISMTNLIVQNL